MKENNSILSDLRNIILLIILYTLQTIPLGVTFGVVPMVLKSKFSYTEIGSFSLASYPYVLKVLWSPLVDTYSCKSVGRRRSWIIPMQFSAAILMMGLSYYIEFLMSQAKYLYILTAIFTLSCFFLASQDIAVDSWAITLLSKQNLAYSSISQSIGMSIGFFLSSTVFLTLNDVNFCNHYIYSAPQTQPVLTLEDYLFWYSIVLIIATVYIILFTLENQGARGKQDQPLWQPSSLADVIRAVLKIKNHPLIRRYIKILLLNRVGISFIDHIFELYLADLGFPLRSFALFKFLQLPAELIGGAFISAKLGNQNMLMNIFHIRKLRMILDLLLIAFLNFGLSLKTNMIDYIVIVSFGVIRVILGSVGMSMINGFHTVIADERIGGTYLTLFNSIQNLGFLLPGYFMYILMDNFGFHLPAILLNVAGWVVFEFIRKDFKDLNATSPEEWRVDIKTFAKEE